MPMVAASGCDACLFFGAPAGRGCRESSLQTAQRELWQGIRRQLARMVHASIADDGVVLPTPYCAHNNAPASSDGAQSSPLADVLSNRRFAGEAVTACAAVFTPLLFDLDALEGGLPPRPADAAAAITGDLAAVLDVSLDDADYTVDGGRVAQGLAVVLHAPPLTNAFLSGATLTVADAEAVVTLCRDVRLTDVLARECARVEVMNTANPALLLRANSSAIRILTVLLKHASGAFLHDILGVSARVCSS
eukprot:m.1516798 g.1516798  ORF g.1516798 m.1516798 type:complete len:249 (-) comp25218_c1_seq12:214-960(-)